MNAELLDCWFPAFVSGCAITFVGILIALSRAEKNNQ
jgi:hypothetical protein